MGITHHSNYIRIMEEARVDMLETGLWVREDGGRRRGVTSDGGEMPIP